MTSKYLAMTACAAALSMVASSALAQATPTAPAAAAAGPTVTHGAPVNGVCVLSMDGAVANSTVGKYVGTRMQQIVAQVNAELNGEKTGIDNDARALDTARATLDQNTLEQRAAALQVRANALQRKAQQRDQEVQATEQKAIGRVGTEMEPLVRQAYQQKGCSLLLNRDAVLLGNPAMDITQNVVTALNAKITQFAFDRERLDQAAAAAPPVAQTPAARPAAPAAAAPARR